MCDGLFCQDTSFEWQTLFSRVPSPRVTLSFFVPLSPAHRPTPSPFVRGWGAGLLRAAEVERKSSFPGKGRPTPSERGSRRRRERTTARNPLETRFTLRSVDAETFDTITTGLADELRHLRTLTSPLSRSRVSILDLALLPLAARVLRFCRCICHSILVYVSTL